MISFLKSHNLKKNVVIKSPSNYICLYEIKPNLQIIANTISQWIGFCMPIRLTNLKLSPSSPAMQAAESTALNKAAPVPLIPWLKKKMKLPTHVCRRQPPENRKGENIILGYMTIRIVCLASEKSAVGKLPRDSCDCGSSVTSCLMTQIHTHMPSCDGFSL